jgi:hypothetical protein
MDLAQARERMAELDRERAALRKAISTIEVESGAPNIATAEGRVALFSSMFRGRPDVFATRWESTTQPSRSGWAPKCSNEWRPGICAKPRVKCAACASRRFVALSQAEVRRHLEGRQTPGAPRWCRATGCGCTRA